MKLNTTEEIIADLKAGKMVIIMDDEDRENEGDLMILADHVTPEAINFMVTHCRGLVCLTIDEQRSNQLKLWPQAQNNNAQFSTNFTVSIEAAKNVTTGISAYDRSTTIHAAIAKDAKPEDIVQPGHVFPIVAKKGGVLVRAGHTEAGCDLASLAGYEPASVIVEILKEDGSMARRPDLEKFAEKYNFKIGTIADLIEYRLSQEKTIEKLSSCELPTNYGDFTLTAYQSLLDESLHYALVKGSIDNSKPTFVRVHVRNDLSDLFTAHLEEKHYSLDDAIKRLSKEENGIIVVLNSEQSSHNIVSRMEGFNQQSPPAKRPQEADLRTYGIGAQILIDQKVRHMRLLSAPYKFNGLSGYQLEVSEFINSLKQ